MTVLSYMFGIMLKFINARQWQTTWFNAISAMISSRANIPAERQLYRIVQLRSSYT